MYTYAYTDYSVVMRLHKLQVYMYRPTYADWSCAIPCSVCLTSPGYGSIWDVSIVAAVGSHRVLRPAINETNIVTDAAKIGRR